MKKRISNTYQAHTAKIKAKRECTIVKTRALPDPGADFVTMALAQDLSSEADEYLRLPDMAEIGTGGEIAPPPHRHLDGQIEAVRRPDLVGLEASIHRVELIDKCGAFNLALDAAETVKADNALEQMLIHQMAAAHKACLDLIAKAQAQRNSTEAGRLFNCAARLMDVFQKGSLALHKTRSTGQQVVTVQHVQVAQGGQAIVNRTADIGGHHVKRDH